MALKSVMFSSDAVAATTIKLRNPEQDGFVIDDITGLGPGKAELGMTAPALRDGVVINGVRIPERNIVLKLGYGMLMDPEMGREMANEIFALGSHLRCTFETGLRTVYIDSRVEVNEPVMFTREPQFQVSLICPGVYFRSLESNRMVSTFYTLEKQFEFPFSNESTTEKLLTMGEYTLENFKSIYYGGNVSTGIFIRMSFTAPVEDPAILHENTNSAMRIDSNLLMAMIGSKIVAGDVIEINTIKGFKSVTLIRDGERINILNALSRTSKWINFSKGDNNVSIHAANGFENMQVEITNDILYSGI